MPQALWTALETELQQLADAHAADLEALQARHEVAVAEAVQEAQERPPGRSAGVQHNPLFEDADSQTVGDGTIARHAAEVASMEAAFAARQAAQQEEIDGKSARLADLEVPFNFCCSDTYHDAPLPFQCNSSRGTGRPSTTVHAAE